MNAIEAARRSMYTSTESSLGSTGPASAWPKPAGRRSITEAASRGLTGSSRPSRTSRARSATRPPRRRTERAGRLRSTVGSIPDVCSTGVCDTRVCDTDVCSTDVCSTDLCDQLHLDGRVERENRHPHRTAGVPPRLTEHFEQQLTGPVHDLRLLGEAGRAGHETSHLDHAHYRREAAGHRCD